MAGNLTIRGVESAISASWQRCEAQHKLKRDTSRPILRLQSSEIAPRLEELVELTGGKQGIFRQLAEIAAGVGQCLVLTDADGILVRLENKEAKQDWNGIALGSIWDERTAGTNGVAMALAEGREFTVRGKDHYYSRLQPFACTGIPLTDAKNRVVGTANLAAIDQNNPTDYMFAKQLLGAAADRVQRSLFEREFSDFAIVSVADPGRRDLLRGAELVAVDDNGQIVGSTSFAHQLAGLTAQSDLTGNRFDAVFGADAASLDRVPGRVLSVQRDKGPLLDLWTRQPHRNSVSVPGWRPKTQPTRTRRRLPPSMQDLTIGSAAMRQICERATNCLQTGLPFLVEGETGTGKSALVSAMLGDGFRVFTVDCATLGTSEEDRSFLRSLLEQARVASVLQDQKQPRSALVFDNVDELPAPCQAALRSFLSEAESLHGNPASDVLVLATCRRHLAEAVEAGTFRDDLYYLLSAERLTLPALRERESCEALAQAVATDLSGAEIVITSEAKDVIKHHQWPGNVRQLRNVLQQALLNGDGTRLTALDLGLVAKTNAAHLKPVPKAQNAYDEKSLLMDALLGARWNVSKAARNLGMGRATIHRKMKQYDISRPD